MIAITETEVVLACKTLFGNHIDISRDFLSYVQPSGAKSAYRKKAKENHPDIFALHPLHIQQKQTALFREIINAYDIVNLFFKQRDDGAWKQQAGTHPHRNPKSTAERRTKPREQDASPDQGKDYYRGQVPFLTLQIGQYLYYRGKITFPQLISALVWQRKQRPSMGELAQRWGWIDSAGLDKVLRLCTRPRLFGEKAVELGMLTVFQVNTMIMYQRTHQERLGNYFINKHLLKTNELAFLVQQQKEHNAAILANELYFRRMRESVA